MILLFITKKYCRTTTYIGHSAGAHLLISMVNGFLQRDPNLLTNLTNVILISGLYDLTELRYTDSANRNNLLSLTDENVNRLSPLQFDFTELLKKKINFKVYVAEFDSPRFIEQAEQMHDVLEDKYQLNSNYRLFPNCDHYAIIEQLSSVTGDLTKYVSELL